MESLQTGTHTLLSNGLRNASNGWTDGFEIRALGCDSLVGVTGNALPEDIAHFKVVAPMLY
jgi:hypothetical protein